MNIRKLRTKAFFLRLKVFFLNFKIVYMISNIPKAFRRIKRFRELVERNNGNLIYAHREFENELDAELTRLQRQNHILKNQNLFLEKLNEVITLFNKCDEEKKPASIIIKDRDENELERFDVHKDMPGKPVQIILWKD